MSLFSEINNISKGLDASWLRSETINNNIANVDTQNFKRSSVEFEEYYKDAVEGSITSKKTRDKHMDLGFDGDVSAKVVQDNSTTMRMDGNNVDIDKEMVDLAENVIYYNALTSQINNEFKMLNTAITGR